MTIISLIYQNFFVDILLDIQIGTTVSLILSYRAVLLLNLFLDSKIHRIRGDYIFEFNPRDYSRAPLIDPQVLTH